ncbi:MAG: hypothetical protein ACO3F9_00425 [Burkholderiales bacterium]
MKYLACLGIPFLLQCLVTLIVIQAAPGGSFVGLAAMLFSGVGIPLTAIFNFALIKSYPRQSSFAHFSRSFQIGLILPALELGLLITATSLGW